MKHTLYTIGHSTRSIEEFLQLLQENQISLLIDVRTIPKSRRYPQFNLAELKNTLAKNKILYLHMPALGGLRHPKKDSINTAWKNASFRGYADYMQTVEFHDALQQLNKLIAENNRVAIMCAEAVPWRCHRSLIADAESALKYKVLHIMNKGKVAAHQMTKFAVIGTRENPKQVWYPKQSHSHAFNFE